MTNRDRSTILVVEADRALRTFLASHLTADGFSVVESESAEGGLDELGSAFPDLAIIDVELPDHSGLDLLRHVRESDGVASRVDPAVPAILLVPGSDELDCVRAFERGADDVLGKPLSYRELRCRVSAILRRTERPRGSGRLRIADLEIDTAARIVRLSGAALDLSAKEFSLLRVLAADPTRVFTKAELLRAIWGQRAVGTSRVTTRLSTSSDQRCRGGGFRRAPRRDLPGAASRRAREQPPCARQWSCVVDRVPDRLVGLDALGVHAPQDRDLEVAVVVDPRFVLAGMRAVQSPGVLHDGALPRDRHREHERVQAWVIEALADESPRREDEPRFVGRQLGEGGERGSAAAGCDVAVEGHEMRDVGSQSGGEPVEVLTAFGQDDGRSSFAQQAQYVLGDEFQSGLVAGDRGVHLLDPRLGRQYGRVEAGVAADYSQRKAGG